MNKPSVRIAASALVAFSLFACNGPSEPAVSREAATDPASAGSDSDAAGALPNSSVVTGLLPDKAHRVCSPFDGPLPPSKKSGLTGHVVYLPDNLQTGNNSTPT